MEAKTIGTSLSEKNGKKEKQSWKKSLTKNGLTEDINVCEVENGFLVTHCKYGNDKNGNYVSEEKKYITKENPIEEEEDKSFADSIQEILDEIAESEGMINVD